ncbi:MAG: PAS domain S-box protein, partial [Deltaproteobacteria bacterium]|nr:PAS domain S-box protein [Deltaproteobacteria bacterium]
QSEKMDGIVRRMPQFARHFRAGLRSLIGVPLIYKDAVVGALLFWSKKPDAFTGQDLKLAERIGDQIAGAIANARLFSDLEKTKLSLRVSEGRFRAMVEQAAVGVTEIDMDTDRFPAVNRRLCEIVGGGKEGLQRSEERFRELVDNIHDVFYELDTKGIIQYASPSVEHLFGYSLEETIGRPISDVLAPEDLAVAIENVKKAMAGPIGPREYRVRTRSGDMRWIRVNSSPVRKGDRLVGIRGVMSDITERRQAEEALKQTLDQLECRVRERTIELEEISTALRVLINKRDMDRKRLEEDLQSNIGQLVRPFLSKLKMSQSNQERLIYVNILETNLDNILSPFINRLSTAYKNLTPKEIQVADLVRQGKRTKEIAELLGVSVGTVDTHRNNLRKKLELNSKASNLRSHLLSLI